MFYYVDTHGCALPGICCIGHSTTVCSRWFDMINCVISLQCFPLEPELDIECCMSQRQCWCLCTGRQSKVDVIVADKHISSATLALAKRQQVPVVSSEWVVQCLIAGRRLSVTGHVKYMHSTADWVSCDRAGHSSPMCLLGFTFFTCVSYAEARNRYSLDVRPSVRPSHAGMVSKRLNVLSWFLHHTIDHSF